MSVCWVPPRSATWWWADTRRPTGTHSPQNWLCHLIIQSIYSKSICSSQRFNIWPSSQTEIGFRHFWFWSNSVGMCVCVCERSCALALLLPSKIWFKAHFLITVLARGNYNLRLRAVSLFSQPHWNAAICGGFLGWASSLSSSLSHSPYVSHSYFTGVGLGIRGGGDFWLSADFPSKVEEGLKKKRKKQGFCLM